VGTGRSITAGVLMGVRVAAFIDETVFHQLMHWHHFYEKSTAEIGLVSDGFFHAGGWSATVVGLFLFADLQRRRAIVPKRVLAGALIRWDWPTCTCSWPVVCSAGTSSGATH
jgi:uncharacterized membrane protein